MFRKCLGKVLSNASNSLHLGADRLEVTVVVLESQPSEQSIGLYRENILGNEDLL